MQGSSVGQQFQALQADQFSKDLEKLKHCLGRLNSTANKQVEHACILPSVPYHDPPSMQAVAFVRCWATGLLEVHRLMQVLGVWGVWIVWVHMLLRTARADMPPILIWVSIRCHWLSIILRHIAR